MSRGREGPKLFLGTFAGILQTDDYIAYERGLGAPGMVHACCWSHARRHFVDAVKLNKKDAGSIRAVELIDKLFLIDARAREEKMNHAARHLLRQQEAPPLLDEIRKHILATSKTVLPRSKAGQACNYTLALWKKLTIFLQYPQLELSKAMVSYCTSLVGFSWAGICRTLVGADWLSTHRCFRAVRKGSGFGCREICEATSHLCANA
jgi:transposase